MKMTQNNNDDNLYRAMRIDKKTRQIQTLVCATYRDWMMMRQTTERKKEMMVGKTEKGR